jgi:hypothetical protein
MTYKVPESASIIWYLLLYVEFCGIVDTIIQYCDHGSTRNNVDRYSILLF